MKKRLVTLLILSAMSGACFAADDLSIGRMQVAVWSEYDDSSVLAIYDGRFQDATQFPIKTSFLVPRGSIINDACSLSHEGKHFCQLYTIKEAQEYDEVQLYLPYPNFYLSFHFTPFDITNERRRFSYKIRTNHAIDRLEVEIQQPLRSSKFSLSPDGGQMKINNDMNHYYYAFDDVARNREKVFTIDYIKHDNKPSVDIKYSRMTGPKIFSSPYETQRNFRMFIYLMFATGVVGLGLLMWWMFRKTWFPRGFPGKKLHGRRNDEIHSA